MFNWLADIPALAWAMIKAGRHDKVNVAGVRCYTAIATKDTVLFVNMDKV